MARRAGKRRGWVVRLGAPPGRGRRGPRRREARVVGCPEIALKGRRGLGGGGVGSRGRAGTAGGGGPRLGGSPCGSGGKNPGCCPAAGTATPQTWTPK